MAFGRFTARDTRQTGLTGFCHQIACPCVRVISKERSKTSAQRSHNYYYTCRLNSRAPCKLKTEKTTVCCFWRPPAFVIYCLSWRCGCADVRHHARAENTSRHTPHMLSSRAGGDMPGETSLTAATSPGAACSRAQ